MGFKFKTELVFIIFLLISSLAFPDNRECYSLNGKDDKSRPDIICKELTERFILSFRGNTKQEVITKMGSIGIETDGDKLHYLSLAKKYDGDINFTFIGNTVQLITAVVGEKNYNLIWNNQYKYLCSDFPGSKNTC